MSKTRPYSGNKMSLRSGALQQIKRLDFLSNSLGALGDFLVSTKLGLLMGLGTTFAPILISFFLIFNANFIKNLIPFIFIVVGSLLLGLNVSLTNPSQGSQLILSIKFLLAKIDSSKSGLVTKIKPFRYSKMTKKNVLEKMYKGRLHYIACYKVQGTVTPVSFTEDLEMLTTLKAQFLKHIERDVLSATLNHIGNTEIQPINIATNATEEMIERRNTLTRLNEEMQDNQSLETYICLTASSLQSLNIKINNTVTSFNKGLVVSYNRLEGRELKKFIKDLCA